MLAAEGLHASSKDKRVKFAGGKPIVIDGPNFSGGKRCTASVIHSDLDVLKLFVGHCQPSSLRRTRETVAF